MPDIIHIQFIERFTPYPEGLGGFWQESIWGLFCHPAFKPIEFSPGHQEPAWCTEAGRQGLIPFNLLPTHTWQCSWCEGVGMQDGQFPDNTNIWTKSSSYLGLKRCTRCGKNWWLADRAVG